MKPNPIVIMNMPPPTIQVSSRGYLYAAWRKIRSMCRIRNTIIRLAAQWWMLRMSQPNSTSLVRARTLSYAASGVGL